MSAIHGTVTTPLIRARIDEAISKGYPDGGILGVRARPPWDGPGEFTHRGKTVAVACCVSTLSVLETITDWPGDGWLIVVTDRDPSDLGDGILARIIGHRMRTPDEWEALRQRFSAAGISPELTAGADSRAVAAGLLAAEPEPGWSAAPGGVLTRDHAMMAVCSQRLGLTSRQDELDAATLLAWTHQPHTPRYVADLRRRGGDELVAAVLDWIADHFGAARGPIRAVLASGQIGDVLPLGLVAGLLTSTRMDADEADVARNARIRIERLLGDRAPTDQALQAWAAAARSVIPPATVTDRADALLTQLQADALAIHSDVLASGLRARLTALAEQIRTAMASAANRAEADVDAVLVSDEASERIEQVWADVTRHALADRGDGVLEFTAAVRLVRYLSAPASTVGHLGQLVARHRDTDAWVDRAVADATGGVSDDEQAAALAAVLDVVRRRRAAHDREFAVALAATTLDDPADPGVDYIENVRARYVAPLVKSSVPALLLVVDGMSVATATKVIADAVAKGWNEADLAPSAAISSARAHRSDRNGARRGVALAALPTVTEVSRTSLFCGSLTSGGQSDERAGMKEFGRAHGVTATLFHKKLLDSSRAGYAVSDEVSAAIDDVNGTALVACVLNTVDDALDKSDPDGTDWTVDAIRHLQPLLERARVAGRAVILTADHGHVVERRHGHQRSYPDATSARWRPATSPADNDEVLVSGRRVVGTGGQAVLAVDEHLRYTAIKAGYHGGASPAEVIVPVTYLFSGTSTDAVGGVLARVADQTPVWWDQPSLGTDAAAVAAHSGRDDTPLDAATATPADAHKVTSPAWADTGQATLPGFELGETADAAGGASSGGSGVSGGGVNSASDADGTSGQAARIADAVLASSVYAQQAKLAGRAQPGAGTVRDALVSLLRDPDYRRPVRSLTGRAAGPRAHGAFAQLQRLLNVEGYPVVELDEDNTTVVLDEALLREQFGVDE